MVDRKGRSFQPSPGLVDFDLSAASVCWSHPQKLTDFDIIFQLAAELQATSRSASLRQLSALEIVAESSMFLGKNEEAVTRECHCGSWWLGCRLVCQALTHC